MLGDQAAEVGTQQGAQGEVLVEYLGQEQEANLILTVDCRRQVYNNHKSFA